MSAATQIAPNPMFAELAPGERYVAGKPYVFDMDARLDWRALLDHLTAPDDLSGLSDDALTSLLYSGLRVTSISKGRDNDLSLRAQAERARRAAPRAAQVGRRAA